MLGSGQWPFVALLFMDLRFRLAKRCQPVLRTHTWLRDHSYLSPSTACARGLKQTCARQGVAQQPEPSYRNALKSPVCMFCMTLKHKGRVPTASLVAQQLPDAATEQSCHSRILLNLFVSPSLHSLGNTVHTWTHNLPFR